jgi:DNA-binding LytR/AlgR family response regulator
MSSLEDASILIVEDEIIIAELLRDILGSIGIKKIRLIHISDEAKETLSNESFDLVLLDMRMDEDLTGIELARVIQEGSGDPFMFITAHSDQTTLTKALEVGPVSYITKPFRAPDVIAAVQLALIKSHEKELVIKDGWSIVRLPFDSIIFVKGEGNYIHVQTDTDRYLVRYTLDWFMNSSPHQTFMRIHRKWIVNVDRVKKIEGKNCVIGEISLPVSRNKIAELRSAVAI